MGGCGATARRHSLLGNSHKRIKPRKLLLARLTL